MTSTGAPPTPRKKLARRLAPDGSQRWRRGVQWAFLALNVWIGVQFWLFVRYWEGGGAGWKVDRPPGVEGWLPIASLMQLKLLAGSGQLSPVHPAGFFLLAAFLLVSLLLRKSFCGWLCPVGTVSEWLWKLGRATFGRNRRLPAWADNTLRVAKYLLLGLFLAAVFSMSDPATRAFLEGPYGQIADVKMLNFFRTLRFTGGLVLAGLVILSVFVQNFWCRYLCPYGALLGLVARFSPARIRREAGPCIDCGKCAGACPSRLPVDRLVQIGSVECMNCLECVAVCPAEGALALGLPGRRRLPAMAVAAAIAVIFLGITGYARLRGQWHTATPEELYRQLIPHANEFTHP